MRRLPPIGVRAPVRLVLRRVLRVALLVSLLGGAVQAAPPTTEAIRLRNEGLAQLENEQPADAEKVFQKLTVLRAADPLGWADLAVAQLRQQKFVEAEQAIRRALERAPGDPRLFAILGEIQQWSGDPDAALVTYERAAVAAPDDLEIQFSLYRLATTSNAPQAAPAADAALDRLAHLRPENALVLLQRGVRARDRGDRATASASFLRVRELIWQAPAGADKILEQVIAALEANDLDAARVPALRLTNLLKITPMYREGQRELSAGIQGVPLRDFLDEPARTTWGDPVAVRLRARRLSETPTTGGGLVAGDFDGDQRPDLARLTTGPGSAGAGAATLLEIRLAASDWRASATLPAPGLTGLLAADLDNDGRLDLTGYSAQALRIWRGTGSGFEEATEHFAVSGGASVAVAMDFDIEGDLDLVLGRDALGGAARPLELYLNDLTGPLRPVGERSFPASGPSSRWSIRDLAASDLDRDGDLDLLVAHAGGVAWLDNLRQGQFVDRTADGGLAGAPAGAAIAVADLDNDGLPDLVVAGGELAFYRNRGGRFERADPKGLSLGGVDLAAVELLDLDNDGRLDWVIAGDRALVAATQKAEGGGYAFVNLEAAPVGARALAAADFDGDGDLDLAVAGAQGLHLLDNEGGNANHWLAVRLRGLDKGNSKNNLLGLGAALEVRSGSAYQFRETTSDVTHLGLGDVAKPDLLRVVWTNGVPQNRLSPEIQQTVVEEQVLKGSCPFLYAWNGRRVEFVTDLLWGAPAGLPIAPGVWAGADPDELVKVSGAEPRDGIYDLRVTEELWEAAFFDQLRLWVVDHPAEVETTTALRVLPGRRTPQEVLGTRSLQPVAAAWDARGEDVTARVASHDDVYADGWERSPYQGVAAQTWSFAFDLGEAPGEPIRLLLDGWIFPADASLNLAVAQRGYAPVGPRLEVETADGWQVLMEETGFPAGKTKTLVIDTPPLPAGATRLRLVSSLWLSWDRIAWSTRPADQEPRVLARLAPRSAELRYRGFSALVRQAPNAPHTYDYARARSDSPWLAFPGRYTRYGDVLELLDEADDRSVILAAGDEIALTFDASDIPPPPAGWVRAVFLESHGWDKDADRNTFAPQQLEPLPFRAMSGYPYGPGEAFPDGPLYREYRERWLTREVLPEPIGSTSAGG
jgi:cytochrome c-type biogenesis protein CcmH/NrfG